MRFHRSNKMVQKWANRPKASVLKGRGLLNGGTEKDVGKFRLTNNCGKMK